MVTFGEAVARIQQASSFAELAGDKDEERAYREWAKLVHPDAVGAAENATATAAFARLAKLFGERGGTELTTPQAIYRIGGRVAKGDLADLSAVDGKRALLKVPRSPADNDLMQTEAEALKRLWWDGDPKYRPYAPRLLESFVHEDAARKRRRVNVIERLNGFVPVSSIKRQIDPRDAAWMWRRLLVGLGWAHRAGVVHGAIVGEHVLIHPEEHGLALVDWCYAGTRPVAVVPNAIYPPEVRRDKRASPATDIYMATGLMTRLIGDGIPEAMRRFADGCRYESPRMRPDDAWALLGEFDELLHRLYGPRTFRPFRIDEEEN
jgi:serine/threonine protein kinase